MRKKYYGENSKQYLFSVFYSSKRKKQGQLRHHNHTETELGFIISGNAQYVLADKTYNVNGGDLLIVRSNEQHCVPTINTDNLVALNIQVSSYFLWNVCSDFIPRGKIQALINPCAKIENKQTAEEISAAFLSFSKLFEKDSENVFEIRAAVLSLICLIAKQLDSVEGNEVPLKHINDIEKAVTYIKENYMKDISLSDIAKSAAMSRSYFATAFRSVTGISPYNYLLTTRIEKAVELLKNTDKSVMDISHNCGFTSLTSFNKAFKQLTGITPSVLRKK